MDSISASAAANSASASTSNTLLRRRLISLPGGARSQAQATHSSHRRSLVDPLAAAPGSQSPAPASNSKSSNHLTGTSTSTVSGGKRVANVVVLVLNHNNSSLDMQVQEAMLEVMHSGHVNDGRHLVPLPTSAAKNGGLFMWVVVVPYRAGERPSVGMCAQLMTHFLLSTTLSTHPFPISPLFPTLLPPNLHLSPALAASLLLTHYPPAAHIHMHIRRYLYDLLVSVRTAFPAIPIAANLVSEWMLALNVVCHPSMYGTGVVTPDVVKWVVGRVVVHRIVLGTMRLGGRGRREGGGMSVDEVVERVARAIDRVEAPV